MRERSAGGQMGWAGKLSWGEQGEETRVQKEELGRHWEQGGANEDDEEQVCIKTVKEKGHTQTN